MGKRNHIGTWSVSFAAASLGVWLTWFNYTWFGFRLRAPDWILSSERWLFTAELIALMVGTAITAYRSGVLSSSGDGDQAAGSA